MTNGTRPPASATRVAVEGAGIGGALATIFVWVLGMFQIETPQEVTLAIGVVFTALTSAVMSKLRDKRIGGVTTGVVSIYLCMFFTVFLLSGCRTTLLVTDPNRVDVDGNPLPVVEGSYPGRGALLVEPGPHGPSVVLCTDGEDNWGAVVESFFSFRWLAGAAATVFGPGMEEDPGSSGHEVYGFGGCDQLFTNQPEESKPSDPQLFQLVPVEEEE